MLNEIQILHTYHHILDKQLCDKQTCWFPMLLIFRNHFYLNNSVQEA